MLRSLPTFSSVAVALALLMVTATCTDQGSGPNPTESATLSVGANLSGTMVATVVVDVIAPDIPTMLVFNIPIVGGNASGTITVPAGSNRTITLRGFDAGGVETHSGSTTVNIQPGSSATMSIVLTPLTGDLPVTATLGSFVVTVTPPAVSLTVHGTVQLTAAIKDTNGNPTAGVVTWATFNPGVAIVDGSGLVTATGAGTTTISAVFKGVTGIATVTVTP